MDSRGKTKGESWKEIGSGWREVKRKQLSGQWETTKERVVSSKGDRVVKKPGRCLG